MNNGRNPHEDSATLAHGHPWGHQRAQTATSAPRHVRVARSDSFPHIRVRNLCITPSPRPRNATVVGAHGLFRPFSQKTASCPKWRNSKKWPLCNLSVLGTEFYYAGSLPARSDRATQERSSHIAPAKWRFLYSKCSTCTFISQSETPPCAI